MTMLFDFKMAIIVLPFSIVRIKLVRFCSLSLIFIFFKFVI